MENEYVFFKFREINKNLINSLVKNTIYHSTPENLNDPFDCQLDIIKSAKFALRNLVGEKRRIMELILKEPKFFPEIQTRMKRVGVCSFSLELENPLLWSHYANEHKGICLMYVMREDYIIDPNNDFVGTAPVEYKDDALSEWFIENLPDQYTPGFENNFIEELLKKVLIFKSKPWGYENEARLIKQTSGFSYLPNDCLRQICFGLNTSPSDIELIQRIMERTQQKVEYCKIKRTESDFGIKAYDI